MTNEEIAVDIARLEQDNKSNIHQIDALEEQQKKTQELMCNVDKLAQSLESMVKEQERQAKQIDALEKAKEETFKYWLRTILTAAATGLVGYGLAHLING